MGLGVVIQGRHVGRRGSREPLVDGGAEAGVLPVLDDAHRARSAPGDAVAPHQSLAAVVYDDHFEIAPCLPSERVQTSLEPRIRSQGGDHHRYEEIRQTSILSRSLVAAPEPGRPAFSV